MEVGRLDRREMVCVADDFGDLLRHGRTEAVEPKVVERGDDPG
jgi:hypothetical protein